VAIKSAISVDQSRSKETVDPQLLPPPVIALFRLSESAGDENLISDELNFSDGAPLFAGKAGNYAESKRGRKTGRNGSPVTKAKS
jgi:hypothetical protein